MPVVKLSLTDKYYQKLKNMADAEFMSIQDYIRSKIFQERTIFEPEEAYRRATDGRFLPGEEFTLPDIYGEEWTLETSPAGVFGRRFNKYIKSFDSGIKHVTENQNVRRAVYKIEQMEPQIQI